METRLNFCDIRVVNAVARKCACTRDLLALSLPKQPKKLPKLAYPPGKDEREKKKK